MSFAMDVIGGYRLLRRIGRGGMAEVWVARREGQQSSKFVAVKLIAQHHAGDERYTRMFRAEAELSALLSHSNIVQVFDAGEDEGRSYLVMEWVDGPSLAKLQPTIWGLQGVDDDLRLRVIAYIIGQLLHALSYAHKITSQSGDSLGIVHRDVSPHNVLVSISGDVKLTDFGIAHRFSEETSGLHVKGKLRYMPREQVAGHSRAPTVDLYATGAILHELLEGRKFRSAAEDEAQLYSEALSGKIPVLRSFVPPELDAVRLGLLHPDAKRRIQSADEALTRLKRWSGYGDMRLELGRLCGAMTGTLHPRTGPALAGAMAKVLQGDRVQQARSVPLTMHVPDDIDVHGQTFAAPGITVPGAPIAPPMLDRPAPRGQTLAMPYGPASARRVDPGVGLEDLGPATPAGHHGVPERTASTLTARRRQYDQAYEDSSYGESTAGTVGTYGTLSRRSWRRRMAFGFVGAVGVIGLGAGAGLAVIKVTGRDYPEQAMAEVQAAAETAAPSPALSAALPVPEDVHPVQPSDPKPSSATPAAEPQDTAPPPSPTAAGDVLPPADAAEPAKATAKPLEKRARPSKRDRSRALPTVADEPAAPPPADGPKVLVHFRLDGLDEAKVMLGKRVITISPRNGARFPAGKYPLKWRKHDDEPWHSAGIVEIGANREWIIKVTNTGPQISSLGDSF